MTCIHGLDEINCPNCRVLKSTVPKNLLSIKQSPFVPIENPFFKKNMKLKDEISKEIIPKKLNEFTPSLPKPPLINTIPDFQSKLFLERANEINLLKYDTFGISKKIRLESPEWKFEEDD